MATSALKTFSPRITSAWPAGKVPVCTVPVKLPASSSFTAGAILGELLGTNEVQTLTINATGGTFTGTFGGQTTTALAYNATAAVVQAALEALSSIGSGNVAVQKLRSRWTITQGASANAGAYQIRITTNFGTTSADTRTSASIAYNANTATVDAAIEAMGNVGTGGVIAVVSSQTTTMEFLTSLGDVLVEVVNSTVNNSGVPITETVIETDLGGVYKITYQNDLGLQNVAAMTTTATSLTGGAGTATVATPTQGSSGTDGTYNTVDLTAVTGLQYPKVILADTVTTNSSGLVINDDGTTATHATAYITGSFRSDDVPGITDAILAAKGGRWLVGNAAGGIFQW